MKSLIAALIFGTVAVTAGAAAAAEDAIEASAAAAASTSFIKVRKSCGTAATLHFCTDLKPDDVGPKKISAYRVSFPKKGVALVTWSGAVYCDAISVPDVGPTQFNLRVGETSIFVDLAITQGAGKIVYNAPGATSVGETLRSFVPREVGFAQVARTFLTPVTLTKTFPVNPGAQTYQVSVAGRFLKHGSGAFCNVNGGQMLVQFYPG